MNRREGIIVGALLLSTFIGSTFAAPAVQQMLIVNDPLNVRIVGGPATGHTTSVDIDILDLVPGLMSPNAPFGIVIRSSIYGVSVQNLTAAFSFAPVEGFSQITEAVMTIVTGGAAIYATPVGLDVVLNNQAPLSVPLNWDNYGTATTVPIPIHYVSLGLNALSIALVVPANSQGGSFVFVYEVRLTVEYTFTA